MDLRERLIEALSARFHFQIRLNKGKPCPHEVVDCSTGGDPVLLSAWADITDAHDHVAQIIAAKRADAALSTLTLADHIEAVEAVGYSLVKPCPKGWGTACSRNGGPYCCTACIGDHYERTRQSTDTKTPRS